jgi:transposase
MNDQARIRNRVQKLLETASIKLASVATDVFGTSGRAMLRALADGETDATVLAQLARSVLRRKIPALVEAFEGNFEAHHRFLLRFQLDRLDEAERALNALDKHIEEKLTPFESELTLLMQIPGFDRTVAASFLAETGGDMTVFPTARHLAAWTGVAPGNNETGGKLRQAGARKGNVHLTTTLVQAALGAVRKRGSYYKDKYWTYEHDAAPCEPWSQLHTSCSSRPTKCSAPRPHTSTSAISTSRAGRRTPRLASSSLASKRSGSTLLLHHAKLANRFLSSL